MGTESWRGARWPTTSMRSTIERAVIVTLGASFPNNSKRPKNRSDGTLQQPPGTPAGDLVAGLIGTQAVELFAQEVGLEQSAIDREELGQLGALRAADGLPPPQQQPAFAPAERAHHRPGAKELVASHVVERRPGVLQDSGQVGIVSPSW